MTANDIRPRETTPVRVRTDGEVDEEALTYLREKVNAALDRAGRPVSGEVRVVRATAHHVVKPWSACAEVRFGGELVVVHAREASAHELADRLHDRLRAGTERAAHRGDATRRCAAPPPWRGGPRE